MIDTGQGLGYTCSKLSGRGWPLQYATQTAFCLACGSPAYWAAMSRKPDERRFDLIGQDGRMSTSKLQEYTAQKLFGVFGHLQIYENHRPDWLRGVFLERMELDFYIPELKVAIEVQGEQHYIYNPFFFENVEQFNAQKERDAQKKSLCDGKNITLYEVSTVQDINILIADLKDKYLKEDYINVRLHITDEYYKIHALRQKAHKSILKPKHKDQIDHANSIIANLFYQCLKQSIPLNDERLEEYYRLHKDDIDKRLEARIQKKLQEVLVNAPLP